MITSRTELHEHVRRFGLKEPVTIHGALVGSDAQTSPGALILSDRDKNPGNFSELRLLGKDVHLLERQSFQLASGAMFGTQAWVTGVLDVASDNSLSLRPVAYAPGSSYPDSYWGWMRTQYRMAAAELDRESPSGGLSRAGTGTQATASSSWDWAEKIRQELGRTARIGWLGREALAAFGDVFGERGKEERSVRVLGAPMRGPNAVRELIHALRRAADDGLDVAIIASGGGSAADLALFNDVSLVRAVQTSPIPVLVAVGHRQDKPLVCNVATHWFATPSSMGKVVQILLGKGSGSGKARSAGRGTSGVEKRDGESREVLDLRRRLEESESQCSQLERRLKWAEGRTDIDRMRSLLDQAEANERAARLRETKAAAVAEADSEEKEKWGTRKTIAIATSAASCGALVAAQQPWLVGWEGALFVGAAGGAASAAVFYLCEAVKRARVHAGRSRARRLRS